MSDNEAASIKTASPNPPLTYAELNLHHQSEPDLDENFSELEKKLQAPDKYMYSYTIVEDEFRSGSSHSIKAPLSPTPYTLSTPSRILNSSLSHHSQTSNHDNYNNSFERYGSLKRGQYLKKMTYDSLNYIER